MSDLALLITILGILTCIVINSNKIVKVKKEVNELQNIIQDRSIKK